jgi:DNA-3-methyladenine glycosylase I
MKRCDWVPTNLPLYIKYHDEEWGKPIKDSRKLFELLCLEGAQAGLSWYTILQKRENYRKLYDGFNPVKIARFTDKKQSELLRDPGIVRNRLKVNTFRENAKAYLEVKKEFGSFSKYIWSFSSSKESEILSKDLKKRGFKFVGPTIVYAFMQASGMVNDHQPDCSFK